MHLKFELSYNDNIEFSYEIFDKIILNGYIQKLQRENQMVYFPRSVRGKKCISKEALKRLTKEFVGRVEKYAEEKGIPVIITKRGENKLALAQGHDNGQEGALCAS